MTFEPFDHNLLRLLVLFGLYMYVKYRDSSKFSIKSCRNFVSFGNLTSKFTRFRKKYFLPRGWSCQFFRFHQWRPLKGERDVSVIPPHTKRSKRVFRGRHSVDQWRSCFWFIKHGNEMQRSSDLFSSVRIILKRKTQATYLQKNY